ncbi:hypothetical protein G6F50_014556 [Rhizopus delemar]|uniref:Uncharacterized protein n=1 Tax=Rhizopus delemar TaxID=936053 RepID=A0A9P6Y5D3_9FUNG|nr:hypothetical protein G6F50_014556 [Rhizopus delemar]
MPAIGDFGSFLAAGLTTSLAPSTSTTVNGIAQRQWRHHQPADRADGPRCGCTQGLSGQRGAAGALPEHLRPRHAGRRRTGRAQPHGGRNRSPPGLRLADLPGSGRHGSGGERGQPGTAQLRFVLLQRPLPDRYRTGLFRAHPAAAFGRRQAQASRLRPRRDGRARGWRRPAARRAAVPGRSRSAAQGRADPGLRRRVPCRPPEGGR